MTIKLHRELVLIQLQQILWTCYVFLSSLNNTFFIVLVIIFSNKSYFCFNYTNTLFIHSMNYFSVVPRIIFLMCIKDYFLIGPKIIFCSIANLFFGLQCIAGLAFKVDWFWVFDFLWPFWRLCKWRSTFNENAKAKHCQRKKQKRFSYFLLNLSGAVLSDEVLWTADLIKESTNRLHNSYTILTFIEHDMSAQLNCSLPNFVPRVFVSCCTCWLSERRRREWVSPTLKFRKKFSILIQMGKH